MAVADSDYRTRSERLAQAIRVAKMREEKKRLEGSLIEFYKAAWPAMDAAPYQHNWHLDAIAEHLEAVSFGWIRRLCINLPPRHSKTLLVSVAWNAWAWCREHDDEYPLLGPSAKFMCLSYADPLAMDNSVLTRRLISSKWYQERWGNRFKLTADQDAKNKFDTDVGGTRISGSFKGTVTGRGAGIRCFPANVIVLTQDGPVPIGQIVDRKANLSVWSLNTKTHKLELKRITGWHRNPGRLIVRVTLSDGSTVECTADHKIWTRAGWKQAQDLTSSDVLPNLALSNGRDRGFVDTPLARGDALAVNSGLNLSNRIWSKLCHWVAFTKLLVVGQALSCRHVAPGQAHSNLRNSAPFDAIPSSQDRGAVSRLNDFQNLALSKDGSGSALMHRERAVSFGVGNVLSPSAVFKVVQSTIGWVAVFMADLTTFWRCADKGAKHGLVYPHLNAAVVDASVEPRIALGGRRLDWLGFQKAHLSRWLGDGPSKRPDVAKIGDFVVIETGDRFPVLVENVGHADKTFCLTIQDNNTFCVGDGNIIVSNCYDDPHKMDEVESETIREGVLRLYDTTLKSRITDPRTSAEVLIAQRGHASDLSAKFLDLDDVVHLNLPAEYDSTRHCVTVLKRDENDEPEITWEDPRTKDGELLWPERFGPRELAVFKKNPYEWQAQWQQAPTTRGGGIIKEAWWQVYEVVRKKDDHGRPIGGYKFVPEFQPLLVIASLDTSFGEKETNDYNALTVYALIDDAVTKHRKILLVDGWQKKLPLHGDAIERNKGESDTAFRKRQQESWGLVEWVAHTCRIRRVDRLLIENKSRGHDVQKELRRLYSDANWSVRMVEPRGDKIARAHAVVDLFTDEMIYAPAEITDSGDVRWLDWADMVIRECSVFPNGSHDDVPDTVTQALKHMREIGLAVRKEERSSREREAMTHKRSGPRPAIYEV